MLLKSFEKIGMKTVSFQKKNDLATLNNPDLPVNGLH